ncbi:MAG: hypothetical protein J7647_09130 [Cyanobacteria bacterium SBLK]|nr:hypothetical protein [Cyanobacteria bacterium SBLK]
MAGFGGFAESSPLWSWRSLTDLLFCVCHVTILTNVNVSQTVLRQIGDRAGFL